MSGALIDLVSKGVQDVYLTGEPQVSFFRQNYKRHTNFSMKPVELNPVGVQQAGNEIVLPIERKGDLLTYVWCSTDTLGVGTAPTSNIKVTSSGSTEFSLHIGGVEIDRQDGFFSNYIWPRCMASGSSKNGRPSDPQDFPDTSVFPLHFFHCDSQTTPLPLVAMQYHNAEIRVKHPTASAPAPVKYFANYVMLDTDERKFFTDNRQELLITQVQKVTATATGADLMYLNHPVKALTWGHDNDPSAMSNVQFRINGTDVFDTKMPAKYFNQIQQYHHARFSKPIGNPNDACMYSFGYNSSDHQPTGTCNFSRLDNAKITWTADGGTNPPDSVYAVNYNILVVDQGLTGLKFSN